MMALAAGCLVAWYIFRIDYLILAALILLVIGMVWSWLAEKISWLWLKFSEGLGWLNSRIILSIIFFLFLSFFGLLFRIFNKNSPFKKTAGDSNYAERDHAYEAKDFELIG